MAEDEAGVGEPVGQVESTGFAGEVGDRRAEGLGNRLASLDISRTSEEYRLEGMGFLEIAYDQSEGVWVPTLGRPVSGSGKDGEVRLGWSIFGFGQDGRLGQFSFAFG
jgi:hypothetical protein